MTTLDPHDQETLESLAAAGVDPALIKRVENMAQAVNDARVMVGALDVVGPLSPEESDLLVMLADRGKQRFSPERVAVATGLMHRGLVYMVAAYWFVTVIGRDVAAEIKAADKPTTPPFAFVRAERLVGPATSQWWAWDELETKYVLTFIHGVGTVCVARLGEEWPPVRQFVHGTSSHITLAAFAQYAGIDVSQIPEGDRS